MELIFHFKCASKCRLQFVSIWMSKILLFCKTNLQTGLHTLLDWYLGYLTSPRSSLFLGQLFHPVIKKFTGTVKPVLEITCIKQSTALTHFDLSTTDSIWKHCGKGAIACKHPPVPESLYNNHLLICWSLKGKIFHVQFGKFEHCKNSNILVVPFLPRIIEILLNVFFYVLVVNTISFIYGLGFFGVFYKRFGKSHFLKKKLDFYRVFNSIQEFSERLPVMNHLWMLVRLLDCEDLLDWKQTNKNVWIYAVKRGFNSLPTRNNPRSFCGM